MSSPRIARATRVARPRALWLRFAFQGRAIRLVERRAVYALAYPSASLERRAPQRGGLHLSGYWLELRNARGRPIYRRILHDPFRTSVEAPTETGWTRARSMRRDGVFYVLVPLLGSAATVVLVGSPLSNPVGRARQLAKFQLKRGR